MSTSFAGAWEMVSDVKDGIAVFTDSYFSIVMADKDRMLFQAEEPTQTEAATAYHTLSTAAGTYEVTGSSILFHRRTNRNPNWTGVDISFEFVLDGDHLTMTDASGPPWVWKKVE